jgi:hypothetical protein
MRIQIQFRIIGNDNSVISEDEILQFDKGDDRLEAMSFAEAKAVGSVQRLRVPASVSSSKPTPNLAPKRL